MTAHLVLQTPEMANTVVSNIQDLSRLKGVDDSILIDLPGNTNEFSMSNGDIDISHHDPMLNANTEEVFVNRVMDIVQAIHIHYAHCETDAQCNNNPETPTGSENAGQFEVPPRLLRCTHRATVLNSPPCTRSRAALSNSFDILSDQ